MSIFTWSHPWKNFPSQKCRGDGILAKNAVFCNFSCPPRKRFQVAANRTILILEDLPMAHLKAHFPNFQKHIAFFSGKSCLKQLTKCFGHFWSMTTIYWLCEASPGFTLQHITHCLYNIRHVYIGVSGIPFSRPSALVLFGDPTIGPGPFDHDLLIVRSFCWVLATHHLSLGTCQHCESTLRVNTQQSV